jgi:hypothetical protein
MKRRPLSSVCRRLVLHQRNTPSEHRDHRGFLRGEPPGEPGEDHSDSKDSLRRQIETFEKNINDLKEQLEQSHEKRRRNQEVAMNVTISEQRAASNKLFDLLEENGFHEVEVEKDYYWTVPDEVLYEPAQDPKELLLGQLSSDLEDIRGITEGGARGVSYSLVPLAAILHYVATKVLC